MSSVNFSINISSFCVDVKVKKEPVDKSYLISKLLRKESLLKQVTYDRERALAHCHKMGL